MTRTAPLGNRNTVRKRTAAAFVPTAVAAWFMSCVVAALAAHAQEAPPVGMRPADVRRDALVNVTVIPMPGERLADAVVLMKDGWIERVGARGSFELPAGTTVHDGHGAIVTAAFVDACVPMDTSAAARAAAASAGAHWNGKVIPQVRASDVPSLSTDARRQLRSMGFAAAALHPDTGIFRGRAHVSLLGDDARSALTVREDAGTVIGFGISGDGDWDRATYPGALMGAIALVRQTLADARWHAACEATWRDHPTGNAAPVQSQALEALHAAAAGRQRAWFDAAEERNALRAAWLAAESNLDAGIIGSGREYRRLAEIAALGRPIVVPMEFPAAPDLSIPHAVEGMPLRDLAHWVLAPTNLHELLRAGVTTAASTVRMKDRGAFPAALRRAIDAGATPDEVLAALTVHPAAMLGLGTVAGTVEPGRLANLAVHSGEPFAESSSVREVWIAGVRHDAKPRSQFPARGTYALAAPADAGALTTLPTAVTVDPDGSSVRFAFPSANTPGSTAVDAAPAASEQPAATGDSRAPAPESPAAGSGAPTTPAANETAAKAVSFDAARAGFAIAGEPFGVAGALRGMITGAPNGIEVLLVSADGRTARWVVDASARSADLPPAGEAKPEDRARKDAEIELLRSTIAAIPRTLPLADFGRDPSGTAEPNAVVIRNATVWTLADGASEADSILQGADVVVKDGKIVAVGVGAATTQPLAGALEIDGTGLHVTPGLIDCHSHTGIDGGVNEWTQNVTAEVSIRDVVDPEDINWYRELAGGVTVANQLHGSANPIGGQNSVVKLRWGGTARDFSMASAPPGIKFALGENVTRNKGRYPSSRMGVETLMRDRFHAAQEYRAALQRHAALSPEARAKVMPPRPDLELDALVEVIEGRRLVHCHSYRQDEILMMLRVAEEFGFRVGTLQHVLEGYKVAEEIARHGAGASSFSDWWAYKMEVMDAIPWNGQMLQQAGVVTSFNSDSDELARRMNTEAAKAVRWGGLPRAEAMRFVTLNPAKQLGIDNRVGSLEPGKDADFVIWSADPLSVYARCMQTWIDGVRRWDADQDAAMRERDRASRRTIVALASSMATGGPKPAEPEPSGAAAAGGTPAGTAGGQAATPPRGSLLARMMATRERTLLDRVRAGQDPSAVRPGECGCDDADVWSAIFESTYGEGGER